MQYTTKWHWTSPVTQSMLGWLSAVLGVVSLVGGFQTVSSVLSSVTQGPPLFWAFLFVGSLGMCLLAVGLFRVTKNETQHLGPSLLPALTGWGHRLGLARFSGQCTECMGHLKFYNKPMSWLLNGDGSRGETLSRRYVAECALDADHYWTISKGKPRTT
ncbi:hypothetical protein [Oerskovia rustica]|uniref:Uncharacterized protein n=1 Tax=Oerskovia rustica TaxID=2762237 RepID=A0ABR8RWA9_9CELL|nr:hypothetical protein [Oerskovia rustica]MBD7952061.1 hypothetical protein [Oerskovia rustica]